MPLPLVEAVIWVFWEVIAAFVFYNTGALLIRIATAGKVVYPIFGSGNVTREDLKVKGTGWCITAGLVFYTLIVVAVIISLGG